MVTLFRQPTVLPSLTSFVAGPRLQLTTTSSLNFRWLRGLWKTMCNPVIVPAN